MTSPFSSAHRLYVKSLYKRFLNNELNWAVSRNEWRPRALAVRAEFDRNRNVHDPRALAVILEKAEAYLAERNHPDRYIPAMMPDGTKWERNLPPPVEPIFDHEATDSDHSEPLTSDTTSTSMKYLWLDVDPGHDDATAIMLAVNCPEINLLGVSTVHGNSDADCTQKNAARCLHAFGASQEIGVYPGAEKPLIRPTRHDPEIHGVDGLGGVEGLPDPQSEVVTSRIRTQSRAIEGMAQAIRRTWNSGSGDRVFVVSCGPMTNLALFFSVYPDLVHGVKEICFMGGGVGLGNRGAVAEFNILCDPEAAQIVLNVPVKKTMIPINVTHTAIVDKHIQAKLLDPKADIRAKTFPRAMTNVRHTLSTVINFFAASYKSTFGFEDGPPLHDALTIAYISNPALFKTTRYRVDVELSGAHSTGETVVDVWNYSGSSLSTWGPSGKNCLVAESVDVRAFFEFFLDCVSRCDKVSPLNTLSAQ